MASASPQNAAPEAAGPPSGAPAAAGQAGHFASLYVGDLAPATTEADLFEVFNPVGPVASIRVCRDSLTRRSLGYAYVNFHNVKDAERALDTLNYTAIKGRSARIMWCQRDPSTRKSGQSNIFVKSLDPNIDNKALYDTFSLFGNILSCKVATNEKGASKGYGFVQYETEEAAQKAIDKVNGMQIGNSTVTVTKYVKQAADAATYTNLYVKQFPLDWDEEKLMELFKPLGSISSSVLMHDKKGRPFAFVNYEDADAAGQAVETLHEKDMGVMVPAEEGEGEEPMKLFVGRAQTKQERAAEFRKQKPEGVTLYIKNLADSVSDDQLRELFEPFGTIFSARVVKDDDGKSRGFGFVGFASADDATKAVTVMHLKVVEDKPLYVGLSERRAQRQQRLEQRYNAPEMPMHMGMMGMGMRPPMMRPGMPMHMGIRPGMMRPGMPMPMMNMQMAQMMQMKGAMKGAGKGMGKGMAMAGGPPGGKGAAMGAAPPGVQKQILGERIYTAVQPMVPELAGKITGMMLEMENSEIVTLLEDQSKLKAKVEEARRVLQQHGVNR